MLKPSSELLQADNEAWIDVLHTVGVHELVRDNDMPSSQTLPGSQLAHMPYEAWFHLTWTSLYADQIWSGGLISLCDETTLALAADAAIAQDMSDVVPLSHQSHRELSSDSRDLYLHLNYCSRFVGVPSMSAGFA